MSNKEACLDRLGKYLDMLADELIDQQNFRCETCEYKKDSKECEACKAYNNGAQYVLELFGTALEYERSL